MGNDQAAYKKLQQRKALIEQTNQLNESAKQDFRINALEAYEKAGMAYQLSVSGPFTDEPYLIGMADSLYAMSLINLEWKKFGLALAQAHNSQKIAELIHQDALTYKNIRVIAEVYFLLNNFEKAEELFTQIMRHASENGERDIEVEALQFLTQMFLNQHEYAAAKGFILKCIDLCVKYKIDEQIGYSYLLYGRVSLAVGEYNKAAYSVTRAMELSNRDRYPMIYAQSLDLLGTLDILMGKYKEAELNFSMMIAYAKRHKLEVEYLQALLGICLVKKNSGSDKEYLQTLKELQALPYLSQHHDLQSKVDLLLSQYYEGKKKYKLSLQHFKRFHTIQHDWLASTLSENLQALEAIHQTESAMAEVELMEGINRKLNAEIQERIWAEKQLRKSEEKFKNLSIIDSLTGLYNRRHFYLNGSKEIERSLAYELPLSVIMMDIDHYKAVNEEYGHRAGDYVLSQLGELINRNIRKVDIACRYGGEEFAILLPETNLDKAESMAVRLQTAVNDMVTEYEQNHIHISASFGIIGLSGAMHTIEDMLAFADDAMYQAKQQGGNKIICCRTTASD